MNQSPEISFHRSRLEGLCLGMWLRRSRRGNIADRLSFLQKSSSHGTATEPEKKTYLVCSGEPPNLNGVYSLNIILENDLNLLRHLRSKIFKKEQATIATKAQRDSPAFMNKILRKRKIKAHARPRQPIFRMTRRTHLHSLICGINHDRSVSLCVLCFSRSVFGIQ